MDFRQFFHEQIHRETVIMIRFLDMTNSVLVKHVQCRNVVAKLELVDDFKNCEYVYVYSKRYHLTIYTHSFLQSPQVSCTEMDHSGHSTVH